MRKPTIHCLKTFGMNIQAKYETEPSRISNLAFSRCCFVILPAVPAPIFTNRVITSEMERKRVLHPQNERETQSIAKEEEKSLEGFASPSLFPSSVSELSLRPSPSLRPDMDMTSQFTHNYLLCSVE